MGMEIDMVVREGRKARWFKKENHMHPQDKKKKPRRRKGERCGAGKECLPPHLAYFDGCRGGRDLTGSRDGRKEENKANPKKKKKKGDLDP